MKKTSRELRKLPFLKDASAENFDRIVRNQTMDVSAPLLSAKWVVNGLWEGSALERVDELDEQQLRAWLDTELPELDGKTPRRAVRSKAGRRRVLHLLKSIERGEHLNARDRGTEPRDVAWMWKELGLEEMRPAGDAGRRLTGG